MRRHMRMITYKRTKNGGHRYGYYIFRTRGLQNLFYKSPVRLFGSIRQKCCTWVFFRA